MRPLELLFVIAFVLYTIVIGSHRIKQKLHPWMVWLFGGALMADFSGTVFLCIVSAESWRFTLHTVSGLVSLLIMALHFSWALLAIYAHGKFEAYFNRFSLYAWGLWFISFVSGIPL